MRQTLPVLQQLFPEARIRIRPLSSGLHQLHRLRESQLLLPHQVGHHETGTPGDPGRAVQQDVSFLVLHLGHPGVVVLEVLFDLLLGEVLDLVDPVAILGILLEGRVQMSPADPNGSDVELDQQLWGGSGILVAEVKSLLDQVYFWVLLEAIVLVVFGELYLFLVAGVADAVLLIVEDQLLGGSAQVALLMDCPLHPDYI